MRELKFSSLRSKGTLYPRRLWRPGDTALVDDEVAEALLREPGFSVTRRRKRAEE